MIVRTTAALLLTLAFAAAGDPPALVWKTDLDGALAEAKRTGKPVLVNVLDSI